MNRLRVQRKHGFTLAEVLIALALIGLVAAFAIPKTMQNVAESQNRSKVKKTVSIPYTRFYPGII